MFNVSPLLLDDALKPATPLTNWDRVKMRGGAVLPGGSRTL